jgi:hypothetical protein
MDWKPLRLEDRAIVSDALKKHPMGLSDHIFSNLWMWNGTRNYELAHVEGAIGIRYTENNESIFLYPIGDKSRRSILESMAREYAPMKMRAIPESAVAELQGFPFQLVEDPDHFDYIYSFENLLHLKGNDLQPKRNLIHQFESNYPYNYLTLTPELLPKVIEMDKKWFAEHPEPPLFMQHEHLACQRGLEYYKELQLIGGAIEVEGTIIAYALAEYMSDNMLLVHVEKGLKGYKGDYQVINNELLKHIKAVAFVNREEDLGVVSLAKGKRSYHPLRLEKKYFFKANLL